jgi:hypothetical protein
MPSQDVCKSRGRRGCALGLTGMMAGLPRAWHNVADRLGALPLGGPLGMSQREGADHARSPDHHGRGQLRVLRG